jgi:UDP-N-acetylglucosamine 2-epimerase (non-hydrolysing)
MHIAVILGTRPEAIKLAPIINHADTYPALHVEVYDTGQHKEMLAPVLSLFGIEPTHRLEVMHPGQTLGTLTARLIEQLSRLFQERQPDLVLVQGDTTTAFCGALAAYYNQIPVGHVEAGLRTGDLLSPWPEEGNRVLISRHARLHFAPTTTSQNHLLREAIPNGHIFVTGNPVIDALHFVTDRIQDNPPLIPDLPDHIMHDGHPLVLITGHRRESFGEGMRSICESILALAQAFPDTHFVYPVHLNPKVREPVHLILGAPGTTNSLAPNVHLIEPLSYQPFVALLKRSTLILTDSGGIQEEAPSLGKPVLVMREKTERTEAIEAGTVQLVGTDKETIILEATRLLTDQAAYDNMAHAANPYGDGRASMHILDHCLSFLQNNPL